MRKVGEVATKKKQPGRSSARRAGLRYVTDAEPGITRAIAGGRGRYVGPNGRPVSQRTLARIKRLVIPPAWTHVWIATDERAHLQVTGRDARGRKQYRYHPDWSAVRDSARYDRLLRFGRALPALRKRVRADRHRPPLSRLWVLAIAVGLLERTLIRIGNEEYARTNKSFGLTTLMDRHATVRGGHVVFEFRAKSGVRQRIDLADRSLAACVKQCQDLPGQTLFQYLDESGRRSSLGSSDVNEYLKEAMGEEFTAKDFRTWAGTVAAIRALAEAADAESEAARKREVVRAIDAVAGRLGNTRSVCRKCYIHPHVIDAYLRGTLDASPVARTSGSRWAAAERVVLKLLRAPRRAG